MKFRLSSVLIGIGQAIAAFELVRLETLLLDAFVDDWMMTGSLIINIAVLSFVAYVVLILIYPVYLFKKQRRADGIVVILSTIISIVAFVTLLIFIVGQAFKGID